jgi:DNA modification methylase
MNFLNAEIGSAKDNLKSPIHNWYKFSAGFSHRFVEQIIKKEKLKTTSKSTIFDPFAGCGTTLVSSQKVGLRAVGNEAQEFMYGIIRAKLSWRIQEKQFETYLKFIKDYVVNNRKEFDCRTETHALLRSLYKKDALTKLYLIRNSLAKLTSRKYRAFFSLALSQTLHKVSMNPIAVPYIVRGTSLSNTSRAWEVFESVSRKMLDETKQYRAKNKTTKIYLHDSRRKNPNISDGECSICITSPPYLNNLDYGEMSKVHSHFWEFTNDWSDITKRVRKRLVTASTTHYSEAQFSIKGFRESDFYKRNRRIANSLLKIAAELEPICQQRSGKKSFDILTLLYFSDMFQVLKEIRRTLNSEGKAYLILGDSAPYGFYIPTTKILGMISKNAGFSSYRIHKIRTRGTKWKSLRFRHSLELTENLLILT